METNECDLLTKMRELLGPNGENWTRGSFIDERGRFCLLGAYGRAKYGESYNRDTVFRHRIMDSAVRDLPSLTASISDRILEIDNVRISKPSIHGFNDFGADGWEDVSDVLNSAIERACSSSE